MSETNDVIDEVRAQGVRLASALREAASGMMPGAILSVCGTNLLVTCLHHGIDPQGLIKRMHDAMVAGQDMVMIVPDHAQPQAAAAPLDDDAATIALAERMDALLTGQSANAVMRVLAHSWIESCRQVGRNPLNEMQNAHTAMTQPRRFDA